MKIEEAKIEIALVDRSGQDKIEYLHGLGVTATFVVFQSANIQISAGPIIRRQTDRHQIRTARAK